MSVHRAKTEWQRNGMPFELGTYSRAHRIEFEPTVRLDGNAAKENIPAGAPHAQGADPEQLFVGHDRDGVAVVESEASQSGRRIIRNGVAEISV